MISVVYYVALTMVSGNILNDSITATGLMIVFYLGITGVACVVYFRKALFNDLRTFALAGLGPALGALMMGYIFVKSVIDLNDPENSYSGTSLLGVQPPLAIAILGLLLGVILMGLQWWSNPAFFRRKSESADPEMRL